MSYRNPPIIVDRSTDVWGKAIAGFGQQVAKGILTASEGEKQKKLKRIKLEKKHKHNKS